MRKTAALRLVRFLLAGGLCLSTLTAAGAVAREETPVPPPEKPAAAPYEPPALPGGEAALPERDDLSDAERVLLALPNARAGRLDRYLAWREAHPEDTAETAVLQVNMDRDLDFYSAVAEIDDPSALTALVNKHYALPAGYVPELEALGRGYGSGSLRPEAAQAFRAMADAARADGVSLRSVSAYRSYVSQKITYNNYLKKYRRSVVDTFSARPGHSEHQTGLAVDINTASSKTHFERTSAFAWLKEHCAEYGFILRYDKGKENITGYRFEPWHYRYVGVDIAKACMEQGITFEEYLAVQPQIETSPDQPAGGCPVIPNMPLQENGSYMV